MDIEKTMEFILAVQARLEASAQGHEERIAKLESSVATLSGSVATVTDLVGRLAQTEIRLAERTGGLAERMEVGFQELRELHADTQYKLNALIETVDSSFAATGTKNNSSVRVFRPL